MALEFMKFIKPTKSGYVALCHEILHMEPTPYFIGKMGFLTGFYVTIILFGQING